MNSNFLALFEAIRRRDLDRAILNASIEASLTRLAINVGMTHAEIRAALDSERGLVIYEP